MIGEFIRDIFYIGVGYGIVGTLVIEVIIIGIHHLIGKRRKDGEQR